MLSKYPTQKRFEALLEMNRATWSTGPDTTRLDISRYDNFASSQILIWLTAYNSCDYHVEFSSITDQKGITCRKVHLTRPCNTAQRGCIDFGYQGKIMARYARAHCGLA